MDKIDDRRAVSSYRPLPREESAKILHESRLDRSVRDEQFVVPENRHRGGTAADAAKRRFDNHARLGGGSCRSRL